MSLDQVIQNQDKMAAAWEAFKSTNDARLAEIEKKGSADPLITEQLNKIGTAMDEQKARLNELETKHNRAGLGGGDKVENKDDPEYKTALLHYLKKGDMSRLTSLETKALSANSDPDGGYLVTPTMSSRIITIINETTPMRKLATIENISSDLLEIIEDRDDVASGWVAETAPRPDTNTPVVGKRTIPVHQVYAQPKATQQLIDDAVTDIEKWVTEKTADALGRKEATAFITGNGVGQPRGITTYANGTGWGQIEQLGSGSSATVVADKLIELFYKLKGDYANNATWLMNRLTVSQCRLLKEAVTGQYLWQPGLVLGAPDLLLGRPVEWAADMAIPAANSLSIAVGDFKRAYTIVDRTGISVLRDNLTDKPYVKFYTLKRVGGDVTNFEAIKIQKLG